MVKGTQEKRLVKKRDTKLVEMEMRWGARHTDLETKFSQKVAQRKEGFRRRHKIGLVKKIEGTVGIKVYKNEFCLLGPTAEEREAESIRLAKKLYKNLERETYSVYMGFENDDTDSMIDFAATLGVQVFLLDTPESWGYTFIAVKNVPLSDRFYNPIEDLEIDRDQSISDNDFRKHELYPYSFISNPQKLEMGEVPQRCKDQLINF